MTRGLAIAALIVIAVALLFFLHPQELLSLTLPPPRSIEVAVERIRGDGQSVVASRTVIGSEAATLYDAVRALQAEPLGTGTGCHVNPQGKLVYVLTFRYDTRPRQFLVENVCGEWVVGTRIWKHSAALSADLRHIVPKGGA